MNIKLWWQVFKRQYFGIILITVLVNSVFLEERQRIEVKQGYKIEGSPDYRIHVGGHTMTQEALDSDPKKKTDVVNLTLDGPVRTDLQVRLKFSHDKDR